MWFALGIVETPENPVLALGFVGAVVATFVLGFFLDVDPSLKGGFSFVVFALITTLLIRRATKN